MRIAKSGTLVYQALLALILGLGGTVVGAATPPLGAWLGLVPVVLILGIALRRPLRRWRLARRTFPEDWRAWLDAHVPLFGRLNTTARRRFERDVQFFLAENTFEGVDGVNVTPNLRLAVAAGAALMLHGRPDWEIEARRTFLFYPGSFDEDYFDSAYASFDGMVHAQGPVILSREAVEESWAQPDDGSNVVLHELAHLFDFNDTRADGAPSLMSPASAEAWGRLVRAEMRKARLGRSLLRRYAATNAAEFFAVAVENFFERPAALKRQHPQLFEAMVAFFNLNPEVGVGEGHEKGAS